MLRLILIVIILLLFYYLLNYLIKDMVSGRKMISKRAEPEELVQDPYCKTYIPIRSALKKSIDGRYYYFCNQDCFKKFVKMLDKQ